MIFIPWILFIIAEAFTHRYFIKKGVDPTPDDLDIKHLLVVGSRYAVYVILLYTFKPVKAEFVMFTLGALFTHLLIFGPLLNKITGKELHYLGNGFWDRVLGLVPFIFRIWSLLVLSAGMIYGYFNTDLL
jgi:hypothetical protein